MKPLSMGIDNTLPIQGKAIGGDREHIEPLVACRIAQPFRSTLQTRKEAA